MTNQHPITPPPELVEQWDEEGTNMLRPAYQTHLCTRAARWGADQELKACCEEMKSLPKPFGIPCGKIAANALRAARRPKPPTLKEQALVDLDTIQAHDPYGYQIIDLSNIRRAIEALPND
jgi:hypothetical protein